MVQDKKGDYPLFSIVVITYNAEEYVIDTLESIRKQTYPRIELIVSDDCSRDQTVKSCENWIIENGSRFEKATVVTTEVNTGIPGNCNRGIRQSVGDWIKIIAGDDMFVEDAFEILHDEIKADIKGEKKVFHGRTRVLSGDVITDDTSDRWGDPAQQVFNLPDTTAEIQNRILLRFCPVAAPTALISRDVLNEVGLFDERFLFWEDRPMWRKITGHGYKMYFINKPIVIYRRHEHSVQMLGNTTFFSRTQLSKDQGYKSIIIPELPFFERLSHRYVISVRALFYRISGNKKNMVNKVLYKVLTFIPERFLFDVTNRYHP